MKVDIIAIGDEILIGQITDTNSGYVAKRLNEVGIEIRQIIAISDGKQHILETLHDSLKYSDIVIIMGGLGPTNDDITKNTLAEYFQSEMVLNKSVLSNIENMFKERNIRMNKLNEGQAYVPECCEILTNLRGTAPGMLFRYNGKKIFSLPGVPFEMKGIFEESVLSIIIRDNGNSKCIVNKTVYVYNIPESMLAEMIENWENALPSHFGLAYLPSAGLVKLRLTAKGEKRESLLREIDVEIEKLSHIIPLDIADLSFESIEEKLGKILKEKGKTLSTAESCTGGYISHLITSVKGSSDYYKGSIISYSNDIKRNILGISQSSLDIFGAVSSNVVEAMAKGVKEKLNTDYAVATSGIAGPDGGSKDKPVGTVWIAIATDERVISKCFVFSNNRERNIAKSATMALDMLIKEINR